MLKLLFKCLAYVFTLGAILSTVSSAQLKPQGHALVLVKAAEAKPGQIFSEASAKVGAIALAKAEAGAKWALDAVVMRW
jgi:hypothetical protein